MAHGDRIGAIAMTEPGAGSDLQAIRTSGRRVAGGFRLSGQKTFISNGQTANLVAVVARTEPEPGARGLSILMLERSEEHTSELQSLMRISYAVFCLKKKTKIK